MELCCATARVLSGLPHHNRLSNLNTSLPLPPSVSAFPSKQTPISHSNPGLRISGISLRRASYFEDTSTSTITEKSVTLSDGEATGAIKNEPTYETVSAKKEESPNEAEGFNSTEETPGREQTEVMDFLNKLILELNSSDTYPILIYGTSALLALWISSAIVGALDSLPLFPKLLELVGLGYTVWFSYRYLIFKRNRDELLTKIEELKERIIGRADE